MIVNKEMLMNYIGLKYNSSIIINFEIIKENHFIMYLSNNKRIFVINSKDIRFDNIRKNILSLKINNKIDETIYINDFLLKLEKNK